LLEDNGSEFCGTERHPCELYLDLNGIEHRRTKVRTPCTNGFVERFNGTALNEFLRIAMRETFYDSVEVLQADLDAGLVHYNTERPHLDYPIELACFSLTSCCSLTDVLLCEHSQLAEEPRVHNSSAGWCPPADL
jgi:hypothetical protein